MAAELNELRTRVQALEDLVIQTRLPMAEAGSEQSISSVIVDTENYVRTLVEDLPISTSGLKISVNSEPGAMMNRKLKTATSLIKTTPRNDTSWKSALESNAVQDIGPVVDSKQHG